jgi:hypothetical protein
MINPKQNEFIQLFAISGKSLETISAKLGEDKNTLLEWEAQFKNEIIQAKAEMFDNILEQNKLSSIERFSYLCGLYNRLKAELDKRDFSGLPTDKLYYILDDVYELIKTIKNEPDTWLNK